jgi:hypothetical protein
MRRRNRLIVGSAIGLAAIAAAIDHTRHRVPEPATAPPMAGDTYGVIGTPCGPPPVPCGFAGDPCSLPPPPAPCGL